MLEQFRQTHDSNRSEFIKHISIISVAGLGYNLIENKRSIFTQGWDVCFWYISSGGFIATILLVLLMFYTASTHSEALYRAHNAGEGTDAYQWYLEKAANREKLLKWTGIALTITFTVALFSAIKLEV